MNEQTHNIIGARLSYEDMANPLRVGTVVEHRGSEFRIVWDDEEDGEIWSDLRQAGWRLMAKHAPASIGWVRGWGRAQPPF